jgi:20S proteasome alpha/beta subunit
MTCVIAAKGADGSAIIADTRVLRNEYEANNESKISLIPESPPYRVAIAGAGATALLDKLAQQVRETQYPSPLTFRRLEESIEDITRGIYLRYLPSLGDDAKFGVVFMALKDLDKGDPELRLIEAEKPAAEEIKDWAIIGHASQYASSIFKMMYDPNLTAKELAVLGWFTITSIVYMGLDQTIGMNIYGPEAIIQKTNEEPQFLQALDDDDFKTARESLANWEGPRKLVTSVWQRIPIAYEGALLAGQLPDFKLEELKERAIMQKLGIDGFDVFACELCNKRSYHPTRWRDQIKNCPYCGSNKVKYERTAIIPMH